MCLQGYVLIGLFTLRGAGLIFVHISLLPLVAVASFRAKETFPPFRRSAVLPFRRFASRRIIA